MIIPMEAMPLRFNPFEEKTMTTRKPEEFTAEEVAKCQVEFPGLTEKEARISLERRQVYGDPYQNHAGIAAAWAGVLQVWAPRIARGDALPPHVIAILMGQLKMNRCRLQHHQDNYDDASVYMTFASSFQQRWEREGGEKPCPDPMAYFVDPVKIELKAETLMGDRCPHVALLNLPGGWQCSECGKKVGPKKEGAARGATSIREEPRDQASA